MAKIETMQFTEANTAKDVADIELCKKIYEELEKHYPGHQWCVGANSESGVFDIRLLYLDGNRSRGLGDYGWLGHLRNLDSESAMKKVRNAGGELLERYRLPRQGYREGDKFKAVENGMDISNAIEKSRGSTI